MDNSRKHNRGQRKCSEFVCISCTTGSILNLCITSHTLRVLGTAADAKDSKAVWIPEPLEVINHGRQKQWVKSHIFQSKNVWGGEGGGVGVGVSNRKRTSAASADEQAKVSNQPSLGREAAI